LLAYIPVRFDLYRTVRPALRWTLQNLVAFADRAGRCFPSVRTLAAAAGVSKSTASRHLAALARDGILTRQRRPGGCYAYTIATRFLPAAREVSHKQDRAVPSQRTEENSTKKKERFDDDSLQWAARLTAWRSSGGRFWPSFAGPRPDEPGCWAPAVLLQAI
jgi:DNA-binding transcriptional ArsR family regulator